MRQLVLVIFCYDYKKVTKKIRRCSITSGLLILFVFELVTESDSY